MISIARYPELEAHHATTYGIRKTSLGLIKTDPDIALIKRWIFNPAARIRTVDNQVSCVKLTPISQIQIVNIAETI
jgi:hypothetical protein